MRGSVPAMWTASCFCRPTVLAATAATAVMISSLPFEAAAEEEPYFDGRVITIIVPWGAGGGTDSLARLMAGHWENHVPGDVSIVVDNRPGANGVIGGNHFQLNAPRDGTAVFLSAGGQMEFVTGSPAAQYDYRDWNLLMATPLSQSLAARADTNYTGDDLARIAEIDWEYAGITPDSIDGLMLYPLVEMIGLDNIDPVFGYDGSGAVRLAFEGGEANIVRHSAGAYLTHLVPLIERGTAVGLMSSGIVVGGQLERDTTATPDLPHPGEFYEALYGEPPSGDAWDVYVKFTAATANISKGLWAHGDVDPQALEVLRESVMALCVDEDFLKEGEELLAGYAPLCGAEAEEAFEWMESITDEDRDAFLGFLEAHYGFVRPH